MSNSLPVLSTRKASVARSMDSVVAEDLFVEVLAACAYVGCLSVGDDLRL